MKNVELGSSLSDIIALGARLNVSLDFRNVETVTASTLSKLLNLRRSIRSLGGRLRLRNVRPFPAEVFRVTRLDTVFEVHPQKDSKIPKRKRQLSR
jgi:anti-anti-sigma factor